MTMTSKQIIEDMEATKKAIARLELRMHMYGDDDGSTAQEIEQLQESLGFMSSNLNEALADEFYEAEAKNAEAMDEKLAKAIENGQVKFVTPAITKDYVVDMMNLDDRWLVRGLLAIYEYQTPDEQRAEETKHDNGVGFSGFDAPILSSFARQWQDRGFLSSKQKAIARKRMMKYAGQLVRIAEQKAVQA